MCGLQDVIGYLVPIFISADMRFFWEKYHKLITVELEKEMATHSSTLAWKIPWTEDPGRLQFMGSQRVGHD